MARHRIPPRCDLCDAELHDGPHAVEACESRRRTMTLERIADELRELNRHAVKAFGFYEQVVFQRQQRAEELRDEVRRQLLRDARAARKKAKR